MDPAQGSSSSSFSASSSSSLAIIAAIFLGLLLLFCDEFLTAEHGNDREPRDDDDLSSPVSHARVLVDVSPPPTPLHRHTHETRRLEPLRVRDSIADVPRSPFDGASSSRSSPAYGPGLDSPLHYAAPHLFDVLNSSSVLRLAVRLLLHNGGSEHEYGSSVGLAGAAREEEGGIYNDGDGVGDGDGTGDGGYTDDEEEEAAELARLRARKSRLGRLSKRDRLKLDTLTANLERRQQEKIEEQIRREEEMALFLLGGRQHRASTLATAIQHLELHFHDSFVPVPGRPIHLHFSRGGDITAYRAFLPASPDSGDVAADVRPHSPTRVVVDVPGVFELFRRPVPGKAESTVEGTLQGTLEGEGSLVLSRRHGRVPATGPRPPSWYARILSRFGGLRRSQRRLILTASLLMLAGAQLSLSFTAVTGSHPLSVLCSLVHGVPSPVFWFPQPVRKHYHPSPHPLLSHLSALMEAAGQVPQTTPFDVAELAGLAGPPSQTLLDLSKTPLAAVDASMPIGRFLEEVRCLLTQLEQELRELEGAGSRFLEGIEVIPFNRSAVVEALHHAEAASHAWSRLQFNMGWWWVGDGMLGFVRMALTPLVPGLGYTRSERQLLDQLAEDPGRLDGPFRQGVIAVLEILDQLVASLNAMSAAADEFPHPTCSRYDGDAGDGDTGDGDTGDGDATNGDKGGGHQQGTEPPDYPHYDYLLPYRRAALHSHYLRCTFPGLRPIFTHLAFVLQNPLLETRRLNAQLAEFAAEVNELWRRLPAPMVTLANAEEPGASARKIHQGPSVRVVGEPKADGVWVRPFEKSELASLSTVEDSKEATYTSSMHFHVFYMPPPQDVIAAVARIQKAFSKTLEPVRAREADANRRTEEWEGKRCRDELPLHSWDVTWSGHLEAPPPAPVPDTEEYRELYKGVWGNFLLRRNF